MADCEPIWKPFPAAPFGPDETTGRPLRVAPLPAAARRAAFPRRPGAGRARARPWQRGRAGGGRAAVARAPGRPRGPHAPARPDSRAATGSCAGRRTTCTRSSRCASRARRCRPGSSPTRARCSPCGASAPADQVRRLRRLDDALLSADGRLTSRRLRAHRAPAGRRARDDRVRGRRVLPPRRRRRLHAARRRGPHPRPVARRRGRRARSTPRHRRRAGRSPRRATPR